MRRTVFFAGIVSFVSAFLGVVLGFGLVVPSLASAQPSVQQEVRANAFVLVAEDGSEGARLRFTPGGAATLQFIRPNGTVGSSFSVPGFTYFNANGDVLMRVGRCVVGAGGFSCPGGLPSFEGVQLGPDGSIGVLPSP